MSILNIFTIYPQLIFIGNSVGWYGPFDQFSKDSIIAGVDLERNNKQIYIPPNIIWYKQLPGYNLRFIVHDKYNCYLEIDSIIFNIYSIAPSNSILHSTLAENNKFTCPYNRDHGIVDIYNFYLLDELKRYKEDLLIDFTMYLQTKNNEQRKMVFSRYELRYEKNGGGVAFWRY